MHSGGSISSTMLLAIPRRSPASGVANAKPSDVGDDSDERLLERYLNGDNAAFRGLISRYERELYAFLARFLGDRAAAEDVFQEAFLQVHQSGHSFDPSRRFRPWLFTIAANKARDLMRSQARRPASPLDAQISPGANGEGGTFIDLMAADVPPIDEPARRTELGLQVRKVVDEMPDHLREILMLSYFHQFPYKQIADILEIPLGTVKSRLHAAVASFAHGWRDEHGLGVDGTASSNGHATTDDD
ncbi:MAG: RNA polymerase sigma factor [Planctomycetota bacterium]